MKSNKAPGPGDIPAELLKYGPYKLHQMLKHMFSRCMNGENPPQEWRTSYLTPIHKKGSRDNETNYRGIAVIGSIGRLYSKIIRNKIEEEIKGKIGEEQCGFTAGRSVIDNIFTLKQLIEKRTRRGREVHLGFIDLQKAYDNVPVARVWEEMDGLQISENLIGATQNLYKNNTSQIKIYSRLSDPFPVSKGLRQGCCLSPTLFKIYLHQILQQWEKQCRVMGMTIGEDKLFTLYFADDQVVIAEDADDLSFMIRKLNEHFLKAGLNINMDKSEYLAVGKNEIEDLLVENGGKMKGVNKYKYLGVLFNNKGNSHDEIERRISLGRNVTRSINSVLWNKTITNTTKRRLYSSLVKSVTTYGSEVWEIDKRTKGKLLALEMDYWRRSCCYSRRDRIRNDDIRNKMDVKKSILDEIEKKQIVWYGHVMRMTDERWPKRVLKWVPTERQKRGRPRLAWQQGVQEAMTAREMPDDLWSNREAWRLRAEKRRQL